tara:strand:+ start:157 stop:543 length:387 start_codon:yes stop_codon:yes gene_type:complete
MPTKKKRVGFIPRSDVLDVINKLSFESNLSLSKIINILVEEALNKRGILNLKTENSINYESIESFNNKNRTMIKSNGKEFSNKFNNFKNSDKKNNIEERDDFIDKEIYEKFLMFLQFQERMKKGIKKV